VTVYGLNGLVYLLVHLYSPTNSLIRFWRSKSRSQQVMRKASTSTVGCQSPML